MSERRTRRHERRSKNPARKATAGAALMLASLTAGGIGYNALDASHVSGTEMIHAYGDDHETDRKSVTHDYLEKLRTGEEVSALKGISFSVQVKSENEERTLTVTNPIVMKGDIEGRSEIIGYLGIAPGEDFKPEGYVAVFVSPDTKLHRDDLSRSTGLELDNPVFVDAFVPPAGEAIRTGYEMVFSGRVESAEMYADAPDTMFGGLTPNTLERAISEASSEVSFSGTSVASPRSHTLGIPEGIATAG